MKAIWKTVFHSERDCESESSRKQDRVSRTRLRSDDDIKKLLGLQIGHPHIPFCSSSEKKLIESIEVRERITNACKSYGGSLQSQCT